MKHVVYGFLIVLCLSLNVSFAKENTIQATDLPEVQNFIQEMVDKHQMDKATLTTWFNTAVIQPKIINAISRPYEDLPWYRYKKLFVTNKHVKDGVAFWKKHQDTLQKAEKEYGVPAEIIVAILGVETRYGKNKGSYPVLDSLSTLAFQYPPRATFFKSELEQLLLLAKEQHLDPTKMVGSYAGAIGIPQFISSSYRAYAVDFSGNGQSDLINNPEDAIGSVANYFKRHGWQPNRPVAFPAKVDMKKVSMIEQSTKNPKPIYTMLDMKKIGVKLNLKKDPIGEEKMALLTFEEKKHPEYWVGLNNFYVITRYNHSHHYAMAVYQLAQRIKNAYTS